MNLLDRLEGMAVSAECEGLINVSPSDADELGVVVGACRKSPSPVRLQVQGLAPAYVWPPAEKNGSGDDLIVRVDLARLRSVSLNTEDHLVTAGAGISVSGLEESLAERGFTLGFQETPDLPLGAWLAGGEPGPGSARSHPGWSPVAGLEAVLLEGSVIRTGTAPRSATGPDVKSLLVGGGGRIGVITRATLRVHPAASERRLVVAFADFTDAVHAVVEAIGRDLLPDSFGILDGGYSETILTWESRGEPGLVKRVIQSVDEVCVGAGGRRLASLAGGGEDAGDPKALGAAGPVEMRAAAPERCGAEARMAVGLGARWSRVVLVRRALMNELGGDTRLHLERALPEGVLGLVCVGPESVEKARCAIREAGGHPIGDEDVDSWIEGVSGALLGGGR